MKKYLSGILAVVLAVGISSFSSKSQKLVSRYYFDNGWHAIDESLTCPQGTSYNCVVDVNGMPEQIYKSQSFSDPLKYD